MNRLLFVCGLILSGLSLGVLGCSKDKGNGPDLPLPYNQVQLELFDASALPDGFTFELWAKPSDTALASGQAPWKHLTRFALDASRHILDSNGTPLAQGTFSHLPVNLKEYDSLYVTIEKSGDEHVSPSPTVYLRGRISPKLDSARISRLDFPVSLTSAAGRFAIVSPTDDDTLADLSGIWFMKSLVPSVADSGLDIPLAPLGWIYEGWVRHRSAWLSTGKFRRATGPDLTNPYIGVGIAPDFPGEDFVRNAPTGFSFPLVLEVGDEVMVTAEPDPDSLQAPFPIQILSFTFVTPPVSGTLGELTGDHATIPSGNATIGQSKN